MDSMIKKKKKNQHIRRNKSPLVSFCSIKDCHLLSYVLNLDTSFYYFVEKGLVSETDYITYNQDNESDCGNLSDKNCELAKVQEMLPSLSVG